MNVLVTDSNYKHSLGIVRSIGKYGIKPYLLSYKHYSLSSFSKYSNKEIIIKKGFTKNELFEKLIEYDIELIILVGTNSFRKIVPWKYELKKLNADIIAVDEDILNIALSKKETYLIAQKLGVPYPKTYYLEDLDEIELIKNRITYPCVVKGLYEVGGNIVDYAFHKEELENKYLEICSKYNLTVHSGLPMIQEYIPGYGCAFFAVYDNGKCGLTFQHKRIRELPVSGGVSVCAESFDNKLVEKYGKLLLDSLKWHGVAMVEFKFNDQNIPILMEINPKFWGSTDLALEAGVNFPKALLDIYQKKKTTYSKKYKYPFRYQWPLNGDFFHGLDNPKAILSIFIDLINPKVKSNLWLSDPLPTFKMLYVFFLSLFIRIFRKAS